MARLGAARVIGLATSDAAPQVWSWQDPVAWLLAVVVVGFARWIHRRFARRGCDGCG
ncbi:MAG: hypothetical protein VYE77_03780 [Planctomycetota bacterium]|nr:hypothetical protein [Planctomycetota bacterium]